MSAVDYAQWAVIVFLSIFVLGLTRQLGKFIVPNQEHLAAEMGPAPKRVIPDLILAEPERSELRTLIERRDARFAALVVTGERCTSCEQMLAALELESPPGNAPVVFLTRDHGPAYVRRLRALGDIVVVDPGGERLERAALNVTPFVMLVDPDLRLLHKQLAQTVGDAVARWTRETRSAAANRLPAMSASGEGS